MACVVVRLGSLVPTLPSLVASLVALRVLVSRGLFLSLRLASLLLASCLFSRRLFLSLSLMSLLVFLLEFVMLTATSASLVGLTRSDLRY